MFSNERSNNLTTTKSSAALQPPNDVVVQQQQQHQQQQGQQQQPYMILAQVPINCIPGLSQQLIERNGFVPQQQIQAQQVGQPQQQQAQSSTATVPQLVDLQWAHLLQPTPIRPDLLPTAADESTNRNQLPPTAIPSLVQPVSRPPDTLASDSWKAIWEADGAPIFPNNNTQGAIKRKFVETQESRLGPQEDADSGWAPTPLAEIRAKELRRQASSIPDQQKAAVPSSPQPKLSRTSQDLTPKQQPHQPEHQLVPTVFNATSWPGAQAPDKNSQPDKPMPDRNTIVEHMRRQLEVHLKQHQETQKAASPAPASTSNAAQPTSVSASVPTYHSMLPSVVMPPSVLTSILPAGKKSRSKRGCAEGKVSLESPQAALKRILELQGYIADPNKMRIKADDASYEAAPSPLQLASFGTELVKAIHTSDSKKLARLLSSGLSPNPCNQFRDSLIDLVCKRGNVDVFRCLVDHDCDLRVCDGFGRTPLHHCCWASDFNAEIATSILKMDRQQLFMEDHRGQTPLEYVRSDQTEAWIEFLEGTTDWLFPSSGGVQMLPATVSPKGTRPNDRLPDPLNALSVPLAAALSSGQITPDQLEAMDETQRAMYQ